jgi:glutamate N-acetyltransferase/amino-acid N-acetyltransferase
MTEILARDGEGAEHLLKVRVCDAHDEASARRIAKALVNSPLIKTMVHGADPNVGRLLMAVGKCFDEPIVPMRTDAWINGYAVVKGGARLEFDEATVRAGLAAENVELEVSVGSGNAEAIAYGCDLTKGYVDENAAYYSS